MTNTNGGVWYSVDTYGNVRMHYFATSGYYKS